MGDAAASPVQAATQRPRAVSHAGSMASSFCETLAYRTMAEARRSPHRGVTRSRVVRAENGAWDSVGNRAGAIVLEREPKPEPEHEFKLELEHEPEWET